MAYQWQRPYSCVSALNVWPQDTLLGRARGGQRPAFRIAFTGATGDPVQMLSSYRYMESNALVEGFVMAGGGASSDLYYETGGGSLSVTANGTAGTVRNGILHGTNWGNLFFVADHSRNEEETSSAILASGSNGTLASNTTFDSASYADWTALGANAATIQTDFWLVIVSGDSNVIPGTYAITTAAAGTLTLAVDPLSSGTTASNIVFRLERCPKYLSASSGNTTAGGTTLNKWIQTDIANKGYVPSGNPIIALFNDRVWLAGGVENPRQWYASKQGDPFDFNYSATGPQRAVSGATQSQQAGTMGDPIRALIPYKDLTMLIGCSNSMHLMDGDPTYGGSIKLVSAHVGIIGQSSWCITSDDFIVWMSQDGLYGCSGGGQGKVQPLSNAKLPDELRNLNAATYRVVLAWDFQSYGIHIFVTNKSSPSATGHWFFDWGNKGFWPGSFTTTILPYCASVSPKYASDTKSSCLFGCADGYVRQFDTAYGVDQSAGATPTITSYVDYGPIKLGNHEGHEGMLTTIEGTPAANSGDIDWAIRTGPSAEEAYNASALASGEWNTTGHQPKDRPRLRGHSAFIRLSNGESDRWAIEDVQISVTDAGGRRV